MECEPLWNITKVFIEDGWWWTGFGLILVASQLTILGQLSLPSSSQNGLLTVLAVERGCAFSNAVAFASYWVQMKGLIGSQGLTPAIDIVTYTTRKLSRRKANQDERNWREWWTECFLPFPTVFWAIGTSDRALHTVCGGGFLLSILLFLMPLLPLPPWAESVLSAVTWWMCGWLYLSLIHVSGDWLGLQSDSNTVEIDFLLGLTSFIRTTHPMPALVALRFFAFRKMLGCGICKWYGSPMWQEKTAMTVHYYTQPLPNRWSFYAHHMPMSFHRFSALMTFVIEVWLPYLIFVPFTIVRYFAFFGFVNLLFAINTTGNYGFIGVLNLAENLSITEDGLWRLLLRLVPWTVSSSILMPAADTTSGFAFTFLPNNLLWIFATVMRLGVAWALIVYLAVSSVPTLSRACRRHFSMEDWWESSHWIFILETLPPYWEAQIYDLESKIQNLYLSQRSLRLCNYQGKFAGMHDFRWEPILEGSLDGVNWEQFKWKYKLNRGPKECGRVLPFHLPRLDWRVWFLPLYAKRGGSPPEWYDILLTKLLKGQPEVVALLEEDPFQKTGQRPKFIRSRLESFTFAPKTSDHWWESQELEFETPLDMMVTSTAQDDSDSSTTSHEKED